MKKRFSALALIFACVAGIIFAGLGAGIYFVSAFGGADVFDAASKFASIYNIIDIYFVGDADMDEITDAAYRAMVTATEDRWSYYMTEQEYEDYKDFQSNSYTGIGVTIDTEAEGSFIRVRGVTEDSPAQIAGIKIGDFLIAIDGESLEDMTTTELKALIGEKNGEEFDLTLRDGEGNERTVRLSTALVFSNPVEYYMLPDDIAYIRIKNFESESGERAIAALEELVAQGAKGIVFDVRNNPGGLLSELTKLLDYLLPEVEMFVSVDQNGNETVKMSDENCVDIPMAVLINGNSYSAAEFFAAALWEYDMAVTVGLPTTGKSRSQINLSLADGGAVHLSTNGYLTPNRVDLAEQGGLIPDFTEELSEDEELYLLAGELEFEDDIQLIRAHSVLKEKPAA